MTLLLPAAAFAMTETVWDFRGARVEREWRVSGLQPTPTQGGLQLRAVNQEGSMITTLDLDHPSEVITFTFVNTEPANARLLWHSRSDPPGSFVELPFVVPGGTDEQIVSINVDAFPQWDGYADEMGITLGAGANVILRDIRFAHWNWFEQIGEIWKSFWTFDKLSSFSINFLWGPVITFNPVGTAQLFTTLPPQGRSGNWIFYDLLLLAIVILASLHFFKKTPRWIARAGGSVMVLLILFGGLWMMYDLRMGLELLSYAKHDYDTYISQPPGSREFRSYINFNDVMEQSLPILRQDDEFALIIPPQMPVTAMVRYFAYPSIPVAPQGPQDEFRTWLIFHDDAVGVDGEGRLTVNREPWSKPGKIVKDFGDNTFIFQTP